MKNENTNKMLFLIVCIIASIVILSIVSMSNTTEKFDLAEQLSLGQKYLQELNYEQAILTFSKIIEIESMSVEAYKGLAEAYDAMGDIDNLIATLEKGVAMTGDSSLTEWLDELLGLHTVINWVDSNVELGVRNIINKPTGDIKKIDLIGITNLYIVGDQIFSSSFSSDYVTNISFSGSTYTYNGIRYGVVSNIKYLDDFIHFTNLTSLSLKYNNIIDISSLAGLTNLRYLCLFSNNIIDISPLADLTNLVNLELYSNNITDISSLSGLTNLISLNLVNNEIIDISSIASLTNLISLDLSTNNVSDLSPLADLHNLTHLVLYNNNISDISPLAGFNNLSVMGLSDNNITDLSYIDHISKVDSRP